MFVMVRRSSARIPAQAAPAETAGAPQAGVGEATQRQLDEALRQADLLRERAESDAASIVQKAEAAAEQVAQGRLEVEDEIRPSRKRSASSAPTWSAGRPG